MKEEVLTAAATEEVSAEVGVIKKEKGEEEEEGEEKK